MSAGAVRGLRVHSNAGQQRPTQFVPLDESSPEYRMTNMILDRAISILEAGRGRTVLHALARRIVEERRALGQPCLYTDISFNSLPGRVDRFLEHMRRDFPEIYLKIIPGEAATFRYDWAEAGSTLDDFTPKASGELRLHRSIINDMINTQNRDEYNTFMFQMVISVAHELCHFLTGFLTGASVPTTPPNINVLGWPASEGEAGRWWEVEALGGIVEFYASSSDPRNPRQAGTPYMFVDETANAAGGAVSRRYVSNFAAGGADLPVIMTSQGSQTTRAAVRREHREMSVLRARTGRRAAGTSTAGPSSSRSRAPPPQLPVFDDGYISSGPSSSWYPGQQPTYDDNSQAPPPQVPDFDDYGYGGPSSSHQQPGQWRYDNVDQWRY